jgi:hypothetical protein
MTRRPLTCLLLLAILLVATAAPAAIGDGCGSDCAAVTSSHGLDGAACGENPCDGHAASCGGHCMPAIQAQPALRLPPLAATRSALDRAGALAHSPPERLLRPPIAA